MFVFMVSKASVPRLVSLFRIIICFLGMAFRTLFLLLKLLLGLTGGCTNLMSSLGLFIFSILFLALFNC